MREINDGGWNNQDRAADYGAFLIDHINLFEELDFKDDSGSTIIKLFQQLVKNEVIMEEYKKIDREQNLIRQRRVLVTPTLFHFTVAREEESNKVLRQFKQYLPQFIRLSFVTDTLEKGFYFGDRERFMLGYIHSILKNGFYVGRSLKNTFLSYSNS
jgi:hypothetical protein